MVSQKHGVSPVTYTPNRNERLHLTVETNLTGSYFPPETDNSSTEGVVSPEGRNGSIPKVSEENEMNIHANA